MRNGQTGRAQGASEDPRYELALEIARDGDVSFHYSPFDFVRMGAKVAIVGITPGAHGSQTHKEGIPLMVLSK